MFVDHRIFQIAKINPYGHNQSKVHLPPRCGLDEVLHQRKWRGSFCYPANKVLKGVVLPHSQLAYALRERSSALKAVPCLAEAGDIFMG